MQPSVAILGVGSMGETLAAGLMRAGWEAGDLALCVRRPERAKELDERFGVSVTVDPVEAIRGRDVIVMTVKPHDVTGLLEQLNGAVSTDQVVLSMAAGVPIALFEDLLEEVPVVRAMPNTPAAVDEAITAYCAGSFVDATALDRAESVLGAVGEIIRLGEQHLDAVTAVSGSGPAYIFLLAEALIEAALREGLPHHAAERLVAQTMKGSGILMATTDKTPFALRAQVTSPGGTTAAAMHILDGGGFRALMEDAIRAAAQRSRELGAGTDDGEN
jgi:pyrroline-5-carboxylate reductase